MNVDEDKIRSGRFDVLSFPVSRQTRYTASHTVALVPASVLTGKPSSSRTAQNRNTFP